jgi:predicted NAD-dependent protein-ADP-ribosyltransferase YbiA (DUF1768 family)
MQESLEAQLLTMQEAGIPASLCGYTDVIIAWDTPQEERSATLYLAMTDLLEEYRDMRIKEQNRLDTHVRRTSRVLSCILLTIDEIERTLATVVLPNMSSSPPDEHKSACPKRKRVRLSASEPVERRSVRQLQFYSKSRDVADLGPTIPANWRRILSNFHQVQIIVGNNVYPTPEHAFHAAKALCSSHPSMAHMFTVGGTIGPQAIDAKRGGGKVTYKQYKAVLDETKWLQMRDTVQKDIIDARLKQDPLFLSILKATVDQNIRLVHFDRSGPRSYWGCTIDKMTGRIQGTNRLGMLLMDAASTLPKM